MSPFDLNIRHLAAHVAIATTGPLSEAARRIHLSQPAVTQAMAKLERQLGTPLALALGESEAALVEPAALAGRERSTE
jgi:hypothetical protein